MIANYADHSANERTFLAWVRTVIAIVGFGIGAARLNRGAVALWSEIAMLIALAAMIVLAWVRMRHIRSRILAAEVLDNDTAPTDAFLLVLVAALFTLLAIFAVHVG